MKRIPGKALLLAVLVLAAAACARGPKVIPVRKMEKIYREMLLADQWVAGNQEMRKKADTTWFYEPIFKKYGFNVEDYRYSVDHYLQDPKRYAEMLGRVSDGMGKEAAGIRKAIDQREMIQHRADSIAQARKIFAPKDFTYYQDLFYVSSMTDRIDVRKNERGVWFPVPVVEDTVFHGPELVIKDSTVTEVAESSLAVEERLPSRSDRRPLDITLKDDLILIDDIPEIAPIR